MVVAPFYLFPTTLKLGFHRLLPLLPNGDDLDRPSSGTSPFPFLFISKRRSGVREDFFFFFFFFFSSAVVHGPSLHKGP